jgi:hypothetical protein
MSQFIKGTNETVQLLLFEEFIQNNFPFFKNLMGTTFFCEYFRGLPLGIFLILFIKRKKKRIIISI